MEVKQEVQDKVFSVENVPEKSCSDIYSVVEVPASLDMEECVKQAISDDDDRVHENVPKEVCYTVPREEPIDLFMWSVPGPRLLNAMGCSKPSSLGSESSRQC